MPKARIPSGGFLILAILLVTSADALAHQDGPGSHTAEKHDVAAHLFFSALGEDYGTLLVVCAKDNDRPQYLIETIQRAAKHEASGLFEALVHAGEHELEDYCQAVGFSP